MTPTLANSIQFSTSLLQSLAQDHVQFYSIFHQSFRSLFNTSFAETIRSQWAGGDFSQLPPIEVLSSDILGNARGAYAASSNTIYLADTFVATATPETLSAVLLEEIGHYVDVQINSSDTPGDEGELFSALVRGIPPTEPELSRIQSENDQAMVIINGVATLVEQATADPTFQAPSTNPFGLTAVGGNAAPTFVDIDADGDLDAFVGSEDGNTLFYRNTGSISDPAFAAPSTNPFGLLIAGYATPTFVDIDADGDLDALIGNSAGNTQVYRNTGSTSNPIFADRSTSPFGLTDVGSFAVPTFVDIDADGDMDAFVSNSQGNTLFYLNTGSASNLAFAAPSTNPFGLTDVGSFAAYPPL
jgi:hypothetical protein